MLDRKTTDTAVRTGSSPNWRVKAIGLTAIAAAAYVFAYAPARWEAAELLKAEQVGHEDAIFCGKFQMPTGSEGFSSCAGYLAEIRRRHGDRLAAEAAGLW